MSTVSFAKIFVSCAFLCSNLCGEKITMQSKDDDSEIDFEDCADDDAFDEDDDDCDEENVSSSSVARRRRR